MVLLKLTMNPRKRSKRNRAHRLRVPVHPIGTTIDTDDDNREVAKDMLKDNLKALLLQETSGKYTCSDYLSISPWHLTVYQLRSQQNQSAKDLMVDPSSNVANTRIDEFCREQIVEWSFRVVDYFRIDREVVALSLNFLDRFLATCRCDRTSFKLAATTTLHLAVKLLYPCKLADLGILSDLSRGEFDMHDVSDMETQILRSLSWNLHPPTATAVASIFLDFFFASKNYRVSSADLDDIYDVSSFFCELSVCDYYFVTTSSSCVGIASILNALEGMFGPENSVADEVMRFANMLELGFGVHDLLAARNRLWELYERSEECALHNDRGMMEDEQQQNQWQGNIFVKKMPTQMSPVSVSKPCHSASDFGHGQHTPKLRNESW